MFPIFLVELFPTNGFPNMMACMAVKKNMSDRFLYMISTYRAMRIYIKANFCEILSTRNFIVKALLEKKIDLIGTRQAPNPLKIQILVLISVD